MTTYLITLLIGVGLGLALAVVLLQRLPGLAARVVPPPPVQAEPDRPLCWTFGCTAPGHTHLRGSV